MTAALSVQAPADWRPICRLDDLLPGRGACALLDGEQIALFLLPDGIPYAVGNYDPYSRAHVMSRGLVGSRGDIPTVASPLYKNVFDLRTGRPLDDPDGPALPTYPARVTEHAVEVRLR
jgi:nitrite reductase (NADH) small subunit